MLSHLFYSFVIPTFNRPDEVKELLQSFAGVSIPTLNDNFQGFEIIFVDASPSEIVKQVISDHSNKLPTVHFHRPFLPISPSRNLGAEQAKGDYIIFLDSDVLLPSGYLKAVHETLKRQPLDAFGGPDEAHSSFTDLQKAINFAMTSYLTTGGIRGKKKQMHQYNPRGFNMGIRRKVFFQVSGYSSFTCGEDIELSIRIIKAGFNVGLIPEAFVYHKRRTNFKSFFRQVFRFGAARINIFYRHRSELKITHLFPAFFFLFLLGGVAMAFIHPGLFKLFLLTAGTYYAILWINSSIQYKSIKVGVLSIVAATLQLCGYGTGFLLNWFAVFVRGKRDGMALGGSK